MDEIQRGETGGESSVRQRIVAGARKHFFTHGIRGVTMDDLAEELGMSKKTLYANFAGKTALVEAVILDKFRDVDADLERIASAYDTDFAGTMRELLAAMQRHMDEIRPPFVRDVRRESAEVFELVQGRRHEVIERHFGKLFDEGRRAGIIREDIPPRLAIEILLGVTQAVMNPPKLAELGLSPKSGFSMIISVIFDGILTEVGRAGL
ncbi:MAG: TetR/AcrR family transcriptional regulator [Acidobacteriota bacterium]